MVAIRKTPAVQAIAAITHANVTQPDHRSLSGISIPYVYAPAFVINFDNIATPYTEHGGCFATLT